MHAPVGWWLHESGPPLLDPDPLLLLETTPLLLPLPPLDPPLLPETGQLAEQLCPSHEAMFCRHVVHAGETFAVHPPAHCASPELQAQKHEK